MNHAPTPAPDPAPDSEATPSPSAPQAHTTPHTVAVTGASGFVGHSVVGQLLDAGHHVRALVRDPARLDLEHERPTYVPGNLFIQESLKGLVDGCDAVVHLVGIIEERPRNGQTYERVHVEGTQAVLTAAANAGVKRWVQMSALGTRPDAASTYHQTKWQAEQSVRAAGQESGIAWTILRPSLIHGPRGDFTRMVHGFLKNWFPPFLPYFGKGKLGLKGGANIQPVYVEDCARCFVQAATTEAGSGKAYDVAGRDVMTWPQMYETARKLLPGAGMKPAIAVPIWYARLIAGWPGVPFNKDMVQMSSEDNTGDTVATTADLGVTFQGFEETMKSYAGQMG